MTNELNELATFAIVATERSFTRAAAKLGVSQSALSHTIRRLEQRLDLQLLARTTKSVAPTAAGAALLKDLAPALEQINRARLIAPSTALEAIATNLRGVCELSCPVRQL
jgi:DNA-binding transcriptional LysR family regulator